jgi:hypothetical protein
VTKLPEPTPLGKIRKTKRKIKERRLKDEACYQAKKKNSLMILLSSNAPDSHLQTVISSSLVLSRNCSVPHLIIAEN